MKKLVIGFLSLALLLSMSTAVLAQTDDFGLDDADFGTLNSTGDDDLKTTITTIMQWLFGFLGIVAVLVILYGGFMWMTAGGNDDKVKKAKQILISGIIGLVIILGAYAIASFVISELTTNVLDTPGA